MILNGKLWELFEISFKELERQLLFECNEKGQLLIRLWDVLQQLKEKDKTALYAAKQKIELSSIEEYNRLHNMYRLKLAEKDEQIEKMKGQYKEIAIELKDLMKEKSSLESREHQLTKKLTENNRFLQLAKKRLKILTSENEKLKNRLETSQNKPILTMNRSVEDDASSIDKEESTEQNLIDEFEVQSMKDLNHIAIINIPEKPRSELFKDKEIEISDDLRQSYTREVFVQSELTLLGEIYDKVMVNNKNCTEMAEDFYYKKEVEEEEFLKYVNHTQNNEKVKSNSQNKQEIELIKKKLQEFKEKHKGEASENVKELSIAEKFKGAINKLKTFKSLKAQDENYVNPNENEEEVDKIMGNSELPKTEIKEKDFETEEEESEGESKNDDKRQENIIKELNNETSSSSSQSSLKNLEEMQKINDEDLDENLRKKKKSKVKVNFEIDNSQSQDFNSQNENTDNLKENLDYETQYYEGDQKKKKKLKIDVNSYKSYDSFNSMNSYDGRSRSLSKKMSQRNSKTSTPMLKQSHDNINISSPQVPPRKKNSTLGRNSRGSFQIHLRNSMEPPIDSAKTFHSSFRKSFINNNQQIFFSLGKKRNQDERDLFLDEVEDLLMQGIKQLPDELMNFDEIMKNYIKKKELNTDTEPGNEKKNEMKLLLLYKSENKKATTHAEKFKRANELLEMETAHRTKLEEKHNDLLKNYHKLEEEFEALKKREKELATREKDEKSKSITESQMNIMNTNIDASKNLEKIRKTGKQMTFKKKNKETIGISPKLGKKVNIENKNLNIGVQLLEKIKTKRMKKFENFMHIKLVLKQIHLIYCERINQTKENEISKQTAFANIVYNYFVGLFGLKKIADRRFIIFILSLKKNSNIFRVTMFSRLIGLFDDKTNYSLEELNKYIEALDFLANVSTMGVTITNSESDSKYYIPFMRALQYTGLFADTRMSPEENQVLKQEIETLKEVDPKGINKGGIIDFDFFMERLLSKYRHLVNRAKTYVINAFAACDLDGNKMCNLEEFLLLNRHIEKEKYNKKLLKKIFNENADIDNDGEKNLSFDKFSHLCVEYNLFTDEAQNKYLQITKKSQLEIKMEELKGSWYSQKYQLVDSFDNLTVISKEEKENWLKIIQVLEERIMGNNEDAEQMKPTLIAYNILVQENELLVGKQKLKDQGEDVEEEDESDEGEEEKDTVTEQANSEAVIPQENNNNKEVLIKVPFTESVVGIEEINDDNDEDLDENVV